MILRGKMSNEQQTESGKPGFYFFEHSQNTKIQTSRNSSSYSIRLINLILIRPCKTIILIQHHSPYINLVILLKRPIQRHRQVIKRRHCRMRQT
jgi:hypothetical protein